MTALPQRFPDQPNAADPPFCVSGRLPSLLQCVNLSVVSEETCRLLYDPVYHFSMFCAGGGLDQKDTCNVRHRKGATEMGREMQKVHLRCTEMAMGSGGARSGGPLL